MEGALLADLAEINIVDRHKDMVEAETIGEVVVAGDQILQIECKADQEDPIVLSQDKICHLEAEAKTLVVLEM